MSKWYPPWFLAAEESVHVWQGLNTPPYVLHLPLNIAQASRLKISGKHGVDVLLHLADHCLPLHVAHDQHHHQDEHSLILEYWHAAAQQADGHLKLVVLGYWQELYQLCSWEYRICQAHGPVK